MDITNIAIVVGATALCILAALAVVRFGRSVRKERTAQNDNQRQLESEFINWLRGLHVDSFMQDACAANEAQRRAYQKYRSELQHVSDMPGFCAAVKSKSDRLTLVDLYARCRHLKYSSEDRAYLAQS